MKTNYTFKALSLVAMVMIVSGHVGWGGVDLGFNVYPPGTFHIAIFVFVSGYFYKPEHELHPLAFVKKKLLRLVVPLYLVN